MQLSPADWMIKLASFREGDQQDASQSSSQSVDEDKPALFQEDTLSCVQAWSSICTYLMKNRAPQFDCEIGPENKM